MFDDEDSMGRLAALQGNYIGSEPDKIDEIHEKQKFISCWGIFTRGRAAALLLLGYEMLCVFTMND